MPDHSAAPLLDAKGIKKYFTVSNEGKSETVYAVDDVSLSIDHGETVGLVGESGCGKSTLGRCVVRLYQPHEGEMVFSASDDDGVVSQTDLAQLNGREMRPFRKDIQMIFQDPFSSLNPRMTVFDLISEPLKANGVTARSGLEERVVKLVEMVGLDRKHLRRYPHAFSGGQRQRIGIARALATNPKLVVADEAVSALDVSIQAQILNLLEELKQELGLSYLFIAHDLSVVRYISDKVAVMYVGRIVEMATTEELFTSPKHPYTAALVSAVPRVDPSKRRQRSALTGEIPSPSNPPSGCHFHPRCQFAQDICKTKKPVFEDQGGGHFAACHFADELNLEGAGGGDDT